MTRPRMAVVIVQLRIGNFKMHTANQPSLKCRPQSVSRLSFAESVSFRCEIIVARLGFTQMIAPASVMSSMVIRMLDSTTQGARRARYSRGHVPEWAIIALSICTLGQSHIFCFVEAFDPLLRWRSLFVTVYRGLAFFKCIVIAGLRDVSITK